MESCQYPWGIDPAPRRPSLKTRPAPPTSSRERSVGRSSAGQSNGSSATRSWQKPSRAGPSVIYSGTTRVYYYDFAGPDITAEVIERGSVHASFYTPNTGTVHRLPV